MTTPTSYFIARGDGAYVSTVHAGSAWGDDGLHFSPVAGPLVHHLESQRAILGDADKLIGRISFDIRGRLADDEISIRTQLVRPGRTIELWETTASIQGRDVITARARGTAGVPVNETWLGGTSTAGMDVPEHRPDRALSSATTGRWVGFDTTVTFGPTGQGLRNSTLHDEAGPVGATQQLLTVRRQA